MSKCLTWPNQVQLIHPQVVHKSNNKNKRNQLNLMLKHSDHPLHQQTNSSTMHLTSSIVRHKLQYNHNNNSSNNNNTTHIYLKTPTNKGRINLNNTHNTFLKYNKSNILSKKSKVGGKEQVKHHRGLSLKKKRKTHTLIRITKRNSNSKNQMNKMMQGLGGSVTMKKERYLDNLLTQNKKKDFNSHHLSTKHHNFLSIRMTADKNSKTFHMSVKMSKDLYKSLIRSLKPVH